MRYMTVAEASEKWNVSLRQVQRLVAVNRIPGAQKYGRAWMLPADTEIETYLKDFMKAA